MSDSGGISSRLTTRYLRTRQAVGDCMTWIAHETSSTQACIIFQANDAAVWDERSADTGLGEQYPRACGIGSRATSGRKPGRLSCEEEAGGGHMLLAI